MSLLEDISVSLVENYQQVEEFLLKARIQMFSEQMNPQVIPSDLKNFDENYIMPAGAMWRACNRTGVTVATAGYRAYDHRFKHFSLPGKKSVEITRLYVDPEYRRLGLATQLVRQLKLHATENHADTLYLHTHPFLSGALDFWEYHGFKVIAKDNDLTWKTIHMVHQ
ncbi:MAG: GNAT family N-acetyltransferase [Comamonas sp.]|nr:GNAT family N-acetyltransferase [Comamonas sp.]